MLYKLFYINIFTKIDTRNPGRIVSTEHGNNIHCQSRMATSGVIGKVFDFES